MQQVKQLFRSGDGSVRLLVDCQTSSDFGFVFKKFCFDEQNLVRLNWHVYSSKSVMAKTVEIGYRVFPTKVSALAEIRAVRDRHPDGVSLEYIDHVLLRDLVSLHTEAEVKIGIGISHFGFTGTG